ncbi:ribosome 60S biogenesis N-terminal-domain-containing protein [Limtongia smithiae]|uniref:ribosome 60S biogenesis N-terminal-domain-containing protein n=1 Tax=Limtongia smithiae TaxID=1125753 RepID=UPI0034CD2E0E
MAKSTKRKFSELSSGANGAAKALDIAFMTLHGLLGDTDGKEVDYGIVASALEHGLGEQLVTAWAAAGKESTTGHSFIESTTRLTKLLTTLSTVQICRAPVTTLVHSLLENHIKLVYRILHTQRHVAVLALLSLLAEMARFQGGCVADDLLGSLDLSLTVFQKLLAVQKSRDGAPVSTKKTFRHAFIEILLTLLKNCSDMRKSEVLSQRKLMMAWLHNTSYDDTTMLRDTVHALVAYGSAKTVARAKKTAFFSEWVLAKIVQVYRHIDSRADGEPLDYGLLTALCVRNECGVCFPDNGWHLPGELNGGHSTRTYRVHNRALLAFAKTLDVSRPQEDALLFAIFRKCPELVAAYLSTGNTGRVEFRADLSSIQAITRVLKMLTLPVPTALSDLGTIIASAPELEIALQNVCPSALSKSALDAGLQSPMALVRYLAVLMQAHVLMKAQRVAAIYTARGWLVERDILLEEVFCRIPELVNTMSVARRDVSGESTSTGVALAKYLRMYVDLYANVALTSKFQFSSLMARFVSDEEDQSGFQKYAGNELVEFKDLLYVQGVFPIATKFWNKFENNKYSLFTYLLQFAVSIVDATTAAEVDKVLDKVARTTYLFETRDGHADVYALLSTLRGVLAKWEQDGDIQRQARQKSVLWYLVNEAVARCLQSPFRYLDQLMRFGADKKETSCPFVVALVEQEGYATAREKIPNRTRKAIQKIVDVYFRAWKEVPTEEVGRDITGDDASLHVELTATRGVGAGAIVDALRKMPDAGTKKHHAMLLKELLKCTKYLSEHSTISQSRRDSLSQLRILATEYPATVAETRRATNALIEVCLSRWIGDVEILKLAFAVAVGTARENLEYAKFLQMIVDHAKSPLKTLADDDSCNMLVCMVHYLFFLDAKSQSTKHLAEQVLRIYGGTKSGADRLLLEMLHALDAAVNVGAVMVAAEYCTFSRGEGRRAVIHGGGSKSDGVELVLSPEVFGNSIKLGIPSEDDYTRVALTGTVAYEEFCGASAETATYDPLFMLPLLTAIVVAPRRLVDAKGLIENHCVGYIIACMGCSGRVGEMARAGIACIIGMLEDKEYRERELVRALLYRVYYTPATRRGRGIALRVYANMVPVLANAGHYLHDAVARYLTRHVDEAGGSTEIPLERQLLQSENVDDNTRMTNWMLRVLSMALGSKEDAEVYEREFVFEVAQSLASGAYAAGSTKALVAELVDRGREVVRQVGAQ